MLLLFCAYAGITEADPAVSNVRSAQRTDGSQVVDIYYDVTGDIPTDWTVKVYYTFDGGATWIEAATLTGDTGSGVAAGTNKHAVWNAGSDASGVEKECQVKVVLTPPSPWDKVGIEYVSITGGSFSMGSNSGESDEKPVHTVTVSTFEMGVYEITQGQYRTILSASPSYFTGDNNLPVEQVSWWDAIKFCNALSAKAGLYKCYNESTGACDFTKNGFRLPTEAEWEYACRAGTTTKYYTGDNESDLTRAGWYSSNSNSKTHPKGKKEPNAWGLYDMHGNVWEWCHDWYVSYASGSVTDPTGAQSGSSRVVRGGSWNFDAFYCRSALRGYASPSGMYISMGFRLVRRP